MNMYTENNGLEINETVNLSDLSLISSDTDVLYNYFQLCDLVQHAYECTGKKLIV